MPESITLENTSANKEQLHKRLTAAKVTSLYSGMPMSFCSSIIIASLLACAHWNVVGKGEVILWCLLLSGSLLARLVLWIFWHNTKQIYSNNIWLNIFRVGAWLTGAAWGSAAILLFAPNEPIYQALLAFSLSGVTSGSITSLTSDKFTLLGFVMLTIFPFSYITYQSQLPTSIAMASLSLLFILFVTSSSNRTRKNMEEQLIQNQNLR
jgi:two-component system, LuxR family, sensor kinase FixL